MPEKTLSTHILNKHDVDTNWEDSSYVAKSGELIVYDVDSNNTSPRLKIGDGNTVTSDLPFTAAGSIYSGTLPVGTDLNTLYGNQYWGKIYWLVDTHDISNTPNSVTSGSVEIIRAGYSSTIQIFRTSSASSSSSRLTSYQRRIDDQNPDSPTEWEEIVTSDGSYPTLGAGYLAQEFSLNNNTKTGWANVGSAPVGNNYSCIFFVNGVQHVQGKSNAEESGILEVDYASDGAVLSVLSGNLSAEKFCATVVDNTLTLYHNMTATYNTCQFTILAQKIYGRGVKDSQVFTFASPTYGQSAPANAIYAVVRNIASYVEVAKSAETLSRGVEIDARPGETGWYKFMEASGLAEGHGYSAIILVNGVLHTQESTSRNVEESGIIEVDYYNRGGAATMYGVSILAGNLVPEEFCITASGNSISVYKNLAYAYEKVKFTELSLSGTSATTTYGSELESAAPADAVYAVVRNNASADDNGYSFDTNYVWHNNGQAEENTLKNGTTSLDFNDYLEEGKYELHGYADNPAVNFPTSSSNTSKTNCGWYLVVYARGTTYVTQVAYSVRTDGSIAIRTLSNGTWGNWRLLFDNGVVQQIPAASQTVLGGVKVYTDSEGYLNIDTQ